MQQYLASPTGYAPQSPPTVPARAGAAQWLDFAVPADQNTVLIAKMGSQIQALASIHIEELHLNDACNPLHPSFYDGTPRYDMVVFRGLVAGAGLAKQTIAPWRMATRHSKLGLRLNSIATEATTFFVSDHALITVRHSIHSAHASHALQTCAARCKADTSPHELMLRFLNNQVDAYLALRQPLTDTLDRWQRELLDPRRRFNDWAALLDARLELRKLESLCEEQYEALGELREAWSEPGALPYNPESVASLRVRLSDVMEHIDRVLNHARRLESSVESAIQLHFAAMSHQTNRMVGALTLMTAVFAPLTLLTGFYGMNVPLPWQAEREAVFWIMAGMGALVVGTLAAVFWLRRKA